MNKTIFKTPYGERQRNHCASGSPIANEYGYEIDSYGRKILVKTGETNVYEKIQASLEETKIENILARAMAGDNSVFRPEGIYTDTTQIPSNLIESMQAIQNLENTWEGLPREIKQKYNFDVGQFIGQSGSESWLRDMGLLPSGAETTPVETPKAEVKEDGANE